MDDGWGCVSTLLLLKSVSTAAAAAAGLLAHSTCSAPSVSLELCVEGAEQSR